MAPATFRGAVAVCATMREPNLTARDVTELDAEMREALTGLGNAR